MFKLNDQITSAEYSLQKEKTDLIICTWKSENEEIYTDFLHRIDEISNGDLSILNEILSLTLNCTPPKKLKSNIPPKTLLILEYLAKILKRLLRCMVYCYYDYIGKVIKKNNKKSTYSKQEYNRIFEDIVIKYSDRFHAKLHNETIIKENPLLYCMYYFVVFDNGLTRMVQVFDKIISNEQLSLYDISMIRYCIRFIVPKSMQLGKETKQSWEKNIQNRNCEIWQEVSYALHTSKGNRGRKKGCH